jgi:pyruvate,water dikinase
MLRGHRQRARIKRWVEAARAGMAFREDSHFYFLMPLPMLRESLLEMDRRLRDVGVLDEPEDVFHLRLEELEAIRRDGGDALIAGTPASSGSATGPVTVIREPAEFGRLAAGDVLVCRYTNPAWTTLFQRAAAVVVDAGGPASHAAIVAREYGIPAVMGTGNGTSILKEEQLVTVDGSTGRVTAAV